MEVVVFLAMMIVPFLSVAALVLSLVSMKRIESLKRLTLRIVDRKPAQQRKSLIEEYEVDEV